jgi:hypothetical protein
VHRKIKKNLATANFGKPSEWGGVHCVGDVQHQTFLGRRVLSFCRRCQPRHLPQRGGVSRALSRRAAHDAAIIAPQYDGRYEYAAGEKPHRGDCNDTARMNRCHCAALSMQSRTAASPAGRRIPIVWKRRLPGCPERWTPERLSGRVTANHDRADLRRGWPRQRQARLRLCRAGGSESGQCRSSAVAGSKLLAKSIA